MACERGEEGVDVLGHVVGMRGDAEVAVALGGDDPVCLERGDERRRVGRADADQGAAPLGCPGRDDDSAELVDARRSAAR